MSIAREMTRLFKGLERELEAPVFTWRAEDWPCTPGTASRGKSFTEEGGFTLSNDLILFVRKEVLPTPTEADPGLKLKDMITFEGIIYNVEKIETPPGSAFLQLTCNSPVRGG